MRWLSRAGRARGLAVTLLALVMALPLDVAIHDFTFRYVISHELRLVSNGFTLLGTGWMATGLLGALALVGYRTADLPLIRASLGGIVGIGLGNLAGHVVKRVTCRARPRLVDGWGVDTVGAPASRPAGSAWGGFFHSPCLWDARYQSFPSGHATTAFAVAAALAEAVPARRRIWLAIAGGVGVSRVLLNAHFVSDVLGGSILGWWSGQLGVRLLDRLALLAPPSARYPAASSRSSP
ncbi:MAG TPA: phosphatase PAP2 family protein [Methylomirabilota bacterium]|jgi:undecaprenyl-diphosphatase|nr:phosphatase PAP2 family protein [Methylomirabilota bacterium]